MEFVYDNVIISNLGTLLRSSQLMEFVVVKMLFIGGTAEVQVRDPCTLTRVQAKYGSIQTR